MKLRTIRLENIRRFVKPVEICGIDDGINVLSAPNEAGKSTVFDALNAVFFKKRNSWDKEVRSLKPRAGGNPSVAVEIELEGKMYRIEKCWNSKKSKGDARIESGGELFRQSDEADDWIAETVKVPNDGRPAGLLWVQQGLTDLAEGDAARLARRDLLTSVAGEVDAMTGGRCMDAAQDQCRRELALYLTDTDLQKKGGPLQSQAKEVADLGTKRDELAEKSEKLRSELDNRRALSRELADLEDPNEEAGHRARLAKAITEHEGASNKASREISDPVMAQLEKLDESVRILRRARDLKAVAIAMTYAPGRSDGVSLDGRPLPDGRRMPVPDGARLDIEDIGQLDIDPGQTPDGETLADAEANLACALEAAGASSIADARASNQRRHEAKQQIRICLAKLDTSIRIQAGDNAVEEELAHTNARLEAAQASLDGLEFEVAVLKRLRTALETARASARERYIEPVMKELEPLLGFFWPEAKLRFDPKTLLPEALVRPGTEEDFDILSKGTQEQIALLVRLSFARMLAKAGTPAPVILDDPLVYTDDDRIERMFDALTRQAPDLQIVVFSCRQKAFGGLRGRRLKFVSATQTQM